MADDKNNTGNRNTGNRNTGDWNTGYRNTGDGNTGNRNTGNRNTGNRNTGNRNTGDGNTGDWNTGYRNTGDWNTGDRNTGDWNTGDWNTGYRNTGIFNTDEPAMRAFNKETDLKMSEFINSDKWPHSNEFYLTKWIPDSEMTDKEKTDNPTFHCCLGYLKKFEYKEAWVNFWRDTDEKNRNKFLALPNFDAEIFKEITGIDIVKTHTCDGEIVEIKGQKYKLTKF